MALETCQNCRFYQTDTYEIDDVTYSDDNGVCCRYPPKRIDTNTSGFPYVESDWWCGEYQKGLEE